MSLKAEAVVWYNAFEMFLCGRQSRRTDATGKKESEKVVSPAAASFNEKSVAGKSAHETDSNHFFAVGPASHRAAAAMTGAGNSCSVIHKRDVMLWRCRRVSVMALQDCIV